MIFNAHTYSSINLKYDANLHKHTDNGICPQEFFSASTERNLILGCGTNGAATGLENVCWQKVSDASHPTPKHLLMQQTTVLTFPPSPTRLAYSISGRPP